jgi:2,4-dienoyl-CoA reductase-like NADH-dependent reductase (Old Yellow Enzyme family)/thioredoxin reductase
MGKLKFEKLLEPYHVGPVKTRNRMVKPGAAMLYWHESDTFMNSRVKAFYEAIARGGIGLLIVESPIVDYPLGGRWRRRYRIDEDKYIPGLSDLTRIIHSYGCPTFMQMNHDGPWQTKPWDPPGVPPLVSQQPIASSAVTVIGDNDFHNELPRELAIAEIEEIRDKFASAAVRAEKAGFDGVDINSGSSHLMHNFLSPFWNRRQDIYGGNLENRTRFLTGTIREIKKRLGRDFPVCVTINAVEVGQLVGIKDSQCLTNAESLEIAGVLEKAGVDAIQVRAQWLGYHPAGFFPEAIFYPEPNVPLSDFPARYNTRHRGAAAYVDFALELKKRVSIPVIAVGRFDPELGEKALEEGKADFIAFNRRLIADPDFPNKLATGKSEDIAPCTACHTCLEPTEVKQCRINALLGSEEPYILQPAEKKKRVLVVGGGPAGMEAARVAALRGHSVTLYEKSNKLGGIIPLAALVKGQEIEDLPAIISYLKGQLAKLGVKVELGREADIRTIEKIQPDAVVLATGGSPALPEIPGIEKPIVIGGPQLHRRLKFYLRFMEPATLRRLTRFYLPIGKRVVIIGGGRHGCELAEFLVKRGRKVTLVDFAESLGEGLFHHLKCALFAWFQKKGVRMMAGVKSLEITDKGLKLITREGTAMTIEADHIIPATPLKSNMELLKSLEGKVAEVYAVGDCKEPRLIKDAISDGSRVARTL